ncbi:MAG: hypothetical protein KY396_02515 [Actinobacteria bacterium]|nr:hypothetical protein [Actinomycetota bacterium]
MRARAALACAGVGLASLVLPWAPDYDPLAWLVWGREIAAGELDTSSGPAWKPLPVAVTTALAPAGDAAAAVWVGLVRGAALLAVVVVASVAARLAGSARVAAAAVAAVALVSVEGFVEGAAVGNSEAVLVLLVFAALERHLGGRSGQAFALALAAALLRPEVWPFLAAYAVVLWRRRAVGRAIVAAGLAALPLAWFVPELWGSGDLLRSSERVRIPNPGAPALAERPAFEVVERFAAMLGPVVAVAALVAVALALRRPRTVVAALAFAAFAWVALVAAMSELGYSGEERYLVPAAAGAAVLAGLAVARGVSAAPRSGPLAEAAAALAVAAFVVVPAVPGLREGARDVAYAARLHRDLPRALADAGGASSLRACGAPFAGRYRFPAVAWRLGVHVSDIAMRPREPGVVFRSRLRHEAAPSPDVPEGWARVGGAGAWEVHAECR